MRYKHIFDPIALTEFKESVEWYLDKSERATSNFIKEVNEKIDAISNSPLLFANHYKKFREAGLKKFPFTIVYYIDETNTTIVIISIYHHKRNPRKKYKK